MKDELEHYGVKGMRWGVIRKRIGGPGGIRNKLRKAGRNRLEKIKARKKAKILSNPTLLYRNRHKFSQDQIDTAMKKMKWERELRGLSRDKIASGAQTANALLAYGTAATTAYTLYKSPIGQKILESIKKSQGRS